MELCSYDEEYTINLGTEGDLPSTVPVLVKRPFEGYGVRQHMIIFCYGAPRPDGSPTFCRLTPLLFLCEFVAQGFGVATFDYRGTSTRDYFYQSGLWTHIEDAIAVVTDIQDRFMPNRITVCGSGMGGHVASCVAMHQAVSDVMLIAPAAYNNRIVAEQVLFGPLFQLIANEPPMWANSDAYEHLECSGKPVLVVAFGQDEKIPPDVVARYFSIARRHPSGSTLVFEEYDHGELYIQSIRGEQKRTDVSTVCLNWLGGLEK